MYLLIAGWLLFCINAIFTIPALISMLVRTLERNTDNLPMLVDHPAVSIIVAAKDEAATIQAAVEKLLQLEYPAYELIVVNDRSTDDTGMILDELSLKNDNLRVIHITELPDNWLGKVHAMSIAAEQATGDYLLFTDGDVLFDPQTLERAMQFMLNGKIDHLTLFPGNLPCGFAEEALLIAFGLLFAIGVQPTLVPTTVRKAYVGIGAFNMVRRTAYESIGGHEPLRLDIIDDVKLGLLLKRAGCKQDVLLADRFIKLRWQSSAWGVICGLEKNGFASMDYSILKMLGFTSYVGVIMLLPIGIAPWLPNWCGAGFIATALLLHLEFGYLGHRLGRGWWVFPALVFALFGMLFAFWRSAFITLKQQGVRWRDTFYPLDELRKHLAR